MPFRQSFVNITVTQRGKKVLKQLRIPNPLPRPTCLLATCTLDSDYTCDVQIQSGTTLELVDFCNAGCRGGGLLQLFLSKGYPCVS